MSDEKEERGENKGPSSDSGPEPAWVDQYLDRERGMLTTRDREFLLDYRFEDQLSSNAYNQKRFQIRKRTKNGILDFYSLFGLPQTDIEKILEDYTGDFAHPTDTDIGVRHLFLFFLRGLGVEDYSALTEYILEIALHTREMDERPTPRLIEANVEVNFLTPEDLRERAEAGEELTEDQRNYLEYHEDAEFRDETYDDVDEDHQRLYPD